MNLENNILHDPMSLIAIAAGAAAWFFGIWVLLGIVLDRRESDQGDRLEVNRRAAVREDYPTYRYFEPLIREVAELMRDVTNPRSRGDSLLDLSVARSRLPWLPEEYLATKLVDSLLIGFCLFVLLSLHSAVVGAIAWLIVSSVLFIVASLSLPSAAAAKRRAFVRRMPFAVDLLALLGEAGVSLPQALRIVGNENRGHPLGDEIGRVSQQLAVGKPLVEALTTMRDRIKSEDVNEFVLAVCRGIELGTPMSGILKTQANQMRLKRSQWGEKAAKEAEVSMSFPNLLIMIACIIVILGPILLPVIYGGGLGVDV